MDKINHPPHYTNHPSGLECIDIVEHLPYSSGNAIKYLWRKDLKQAHDDDVKKALWYLKREIERKNNAKSNLKKLYDYCDLHPEDEVSAIIYTIAAAHWSINAEQEYEAAIKMIGDL